MPSSFTVGSAPGALPVVGHSWVLLRRPMEFLQSLSSYGDLVTIQLGSREAYVPCHPELLQRVLTDDRTFDKGGPLADKAREVLRHGLANCPYKEHRRLRRLIQPAFHTGRLEQYGTVIEQEITSLA